MARWRALEGVLRFRIPLIEPDVAAIRQIDRDQRQCRHGQLDQQPVRLAELKTSGNRMMASRIRFIAEATFSGRRNPSEETILKDGPPRFNSLPRCSFLHASRPVIMRIDAYPKKHERTAR